MPEIEIADIVPAKKTALQKLCSYEAEGSPDSIIEIWTWWSLLISAVLKKRNPKCKYAAGWMKMFKKLDGFRWVLRFLGIFPCLNALVTKSHLLQPTAELQRIHLLKNLLGFIYHPLERLSWLKNNTPELVSDFDYDGDQMGRNSVMCWVANMVIDYYLLFRSWQTISKGAIKNKAAKLRDIYQSFIVITLWLPIAVNWAKKDPFITTEYQTGLACTIASSVGFMFGWSKK